MIFVKFAVKIPTFPSCHRNFSLISLKGRKHTLNIAKLIRSSIAHEVCRHTTEVRLGCC
uniref:Uncharacterized protein n=1 Tax=Parascaris equorum TaxID=6256 RepID=A0A914RRY7_PAREQ